VGRALAAFALALVCGLAAAQAKIPRVGFLQPGTTGNFAVLREQMRALGYLEGQSIKIEYRSADGQYDRLPALAADLVRLKVDVILSDGGTPTVLAARKATGTIPIVMTGVADPVGQGIVASLAKPGGNITGVSAQHPEFAPKAIELLRQLLPRATRVAVLSNSNNTSLPPVLREVQAAARTFEFETTVVYAGAPDEIDAAFARAVAAHPHAVIILRDAMFTSQARRFAILAAKAGVPTMAGDSPYPEAGGFASYGPNTPDIVRACAVMVDKILKGTKPSDIPVEQPQKFDLVVNRATAKALGITIPQIVLLRADRVID